VLALALADRVAADQQHPVDARKRRAEAAGSVIVGRAHLDALERVVGKRRRIARERHDVARIGLPQQLVEHQAPQLSGRPGHGISRHFRSSPRA
jgi:hypothetical protein